MLVSALALGAGMREVRLFVSPLKSVPWPLNYTGNTCNNSICSLYNSAACPMIRLQLEEAVLFWHWREIDSFNRPELCL